MHSPVSSGNIVGRIPSEVELPNDSLYTLNPPHEDGLSCGCVLQLTATCKWVNKKARHDYGAVIPLVFYMPFQCKYDIYSSGDLSFVKLTVQSTAPLPIVLRDMKVKQSSLLKSLMTKEQLHCLIHPGETRTLLYQVSIPLLLGYCSAEMVRMEIHSGSFIMNIQGTKNCVHNRETS